MGFRDRDEEELMLNLQLHRLGNLLLLERFYRANVAFLLSRGRTIVLLIGLNSCSHWPVAVMLAYDVD